MAYWLFKTEPGTWSWDDQLKAGEKGTFWDGVRNHLAKKQMMAMKLGDQGFFYHSVKEKRILGLVEVIKEYYPDHTDKSGKFGMVDIKAIKELPTPVHLDDVKADENLSDMVLVNNSRLSVQPVSEKEWAYVCKMGGL